MEIVENAGENHDWLCQNAFKGLQNAPLTQSTFYSSQKISGYWKIHFWYCAFHSSILICRAIFQNLYRGQSLQKVLFLSGFYHNTICIAFVFVMRLFVCICAATTSSPNVYAPVCILPTSICLHHYSVVPTSPNLYNSYAAKALAKVRWLWCFM